MEETAIDTFCLVCQRQIPSWDHQRLVCHGCQQRGAEQLNWLPGLYKLLDPMPASGSPLVGSRHGTAGSRPPLDLHVVDLTGRSGVVLPVLAGWVRDWADVGQLAPPVWPDGEQQRVTAACRWLRWHLDWACRQHPAIDEALREIGDAYRAVHGAATGEHGERRVGVVCRCGATLRVTVSTGGATCMCGTSYGRAEVLALPLAARAGGVAA
jgi:hypothetical protein